MRQPSVDDRVRLVQEIPTLSLPRGAVGIVRSTWFAPSVAYEVEFHQIGSDYQTGCRCLLRPEQVEVDSDDATGEVSYDEQNCHVGVM
jgi:hypothetical protein